MMARNLEPKRGAGLLAALENGLGCPGAVPDGLGGLLEASWTLQAIKMGLGIHLVAIRASKPNPRTSKIVKKY